MSRELEFEATAAIVLRAQVCALKRRVRQYAKALRIARSLTGWATSSDVDAQIRAALAPLPKRAATKRGRKGRR